MSQKVQTFLFVLVIPPLGQVQLLLVVFQTKLFLQAQAILLEDFPVEPIIVEQFVHI